MSDLLIRLRVMARLTGRDDDADTAAEAAREIERLRLTAEEREAIEWARKWITTMVVPSAGLAHAHAESLRTLLERTK